MARFQQMGVSAVVDGYRDYINNVGKMAGATERSHSRIGRLGSASFRGVISGAKLATGAIVGIGAAATAAVGAIGGMAVKLAIDAAPIVDLELGFNAIAENAGQVGSEVLKAMKDVSAGTIRAADLMQLYNKGTTLLGDNFQTIIPFMDQVIAQGAAIGLKPLQAVEDFTTGVARESKMILDNLGIIVNIEDATSTYAATLGKTSTELTATERQTAILTSAMASLSKTSSALPSLSEFATTSIEKMKVTFQETKDEIGKSLVPALLELVNSFQDALGPEAESIVEIFKRDFVPTLVQMARFVGANLPKALKFARQAFIFFGRIVRGLWGFMETFVIPGFNFLYRIFVDKVAPIIKRAAQFFGGLFETFTDGFPTVDSLKQKLIDMIPQAVIDLWETLKTKAGEWYDVALEWIDTHGPDMVTAFTEVKDYIVDEFVPNALDYLIESFDPVVEAAGNLWDALIEQKPNVIAAWEEIKTEARETFGELIPGWLTHLDTIWKNLMTLIKGDIDDTTTIINTWGSKFIETLGDIVTLGIDVLAIAIEGVLQLIVLLSESLVALTTGDWSRVGDLFREFGERDRELIYGFGEDIMDLLNIAGPSTTPLAGQAPTHQPPGFNSVPAPVTVTGPGGGRFHTDTSTQNFSLTVQTSAPVEPVIADFRMLAALARGPIP